MANVPEDVVEWVRSVFSACNERTTEKLSMNPQIQEEALDMSWLDQIGVFSSPVILDSDWVVRIDTHYLGGRRHFEDWEIADIGVLLHLRLDPAARKSKVALLQSKRLYPDGTPVREETLMDYRTGFARLADPEDAALSIAFGRDFLFTENSRYGALLRDANQVDLIARYERDVGLRVYYQFYNPWSVPFAQRIPLAGYNPPEGSPELGVRVVPSSLVRERLKDASHRSPSLSELAELSPLPAYGWRLEEFVCELVACREGDEFATIDDDRIQRLFYNRTGPIAAAIAITVEAPGAVSDPAAA